MAFTYSSPLKHEIMLPNITTKPCLASPLHLSNLKFSNSVPPLNSQKTCAATKHIPTDLSYKDIEKTENLEKLPAGLEEGLMPKHIAFILDGNRRWAVEKGWAPMVGHSAMRMTLKPLLRKCSELNIKVVSLFAFSTENWSRPPVEVDFLMEMYEDLFRKDTEELLSIGCRVTLMGDKTKLPLSFQEICAEIEEKSRKNAGTHVNYAINYSGKYDIIQACRSIAMKVNDGVLIPGQIDETYFKHELATKMTDFPYIDLLIRTSGEERLSNFMLWQMAYSELYFTKKLFPDFGVNDLIEALGTYQERRRQQ